MIGSLGGRRKTIWSVIEQVAKEDLGVGVPTSTLKTLAVEGNQVFQWLAEYTPGTVSSASFQKFLNAAEAWVIARAALGNEEASLNGRSGSSPRDEESNGDDDEEW